MSLGLQERVTLEGSVSEERVREALGRADVFALASHSEPLGVVYMEAMSTGVATVGTKAGGVPELITDGVDGLLVPPGDPDSLAEAVLRLLQDAALRDRLGRAGRATVEARFDSRIGAARLHELLRSLTRRL